MAYPVQIPGMTGFQAQFAGKSLSGKVDAFPFVDKFQRLAAIPTAAIIPTKKG